MAERFPKNTKERGVAEDAKEALLKAGTSGLDHPDFHHNQSSVRLVVEDADATLPKVMEVLDGADVRSVDIPKPSFDEVFLRLMKETSETS